MGRSAPPSGQHRSRRVRQRPPRPDRLASVHRVLVAVDFDKGLFDAQRPAWSERWNRITICAKMSKLSWRARLFGHRAGDNVRPFDPVLCVSPQKRSSPSGLFGDNAVGLLTVLAFGAFVVGFAIGGARVAAIAFWAVELGLPALLVIVSALGEAWTRGRGDELLRVAILAVQLTERWAAKDGYATSASIAPGSSDGADDDPPEVPSG